MILNAVINFTASHFLVTFVYWYSRC